MATGTAFAKIPRSKAASDKSALRCTLCGGERVRRMDRHGWKEQLLFSFFGYYPWRCSTCRSKIFLKRRGGDNQSRGHSAGGRSRD